jgi:hypothetical protein
LSKRSGLNKILASGAVLMSCLLIGTALPPSVADETGGENWINESGSAKRPPAAGSLESTVESLKKEREVRDGAAAPAVPTAPPPETNTAATSISDAVNAAAPGSAPAPLLKGGVTYCVPSGTPLKLKLATIPMPELKGEVKDEEGHYRPAQLDQEITARITEDIYVDDNKVIPEGTVFHGKVCKIYPPRHVGRPGHLELSFDTFTTPDGRSFAFRAEANNFKESTFKSKAKGAGIIAAHAAGGAAVGALVAYKIFGLQSTVAMHGYNIAGGAALGAAGGIAWALWRRGEQAVLEPGDEFAMSINKDLLIPAATNPTAKAPPANLPGLEMDVLSKKTIKDGFGGHMLRLEAMITNRTHKKLNSIDLFVEDDLGNRYAVSPDIDEAAQELFHVQPLSRTKIVCTFAVEYYKLKHKLIWLDHDTHNVIFEQKL